MSTVVLKITEGTREQINSLARITGKPQETVLQEVVETGLKSYPATPTKSVKAVLDLIEWAEKEHIAGPKDLSTNHNTYAWQD